MNKYTLIVFILIFVNCQNNQQKPDINKNTKPLFLDLYPSMSEEEFNSKLTEYENNGILANDKFNIIVNNYKFPFTVNHQTGNGTDCISLDYEKTYYRRDLNIPPNYFNSDVSSKLKKIFKNKIIGLIEIFEKKYPVKTNILGLNELSTNTPVTDKHPFYKYMVFYESGTNYLIFRDSIKTIELVYRIGGNDKLIYNNSNSEIITSFFSVKNLNSLYKFKVTNDLNKIDDDVKLKFTPMEREYLTGTAPIEKFNDPKYLKEYIKARDKLSGGNNIALKGTENDRYKIIMLSVSVNYYYNNTYDSLVKDAINTKKLFDEARKEKMKEEQMQLNILKKNTDNL